MRTNSKKKKKIGREGKVVETGESKFGKRKYNRGWKVEGQWVFGGIEWGSGKTFLVAVHNRMAETVAVIKEWILPGTTVVTAGRHMLVSRRNGLNTTVNHSLSFVNPTTGAHTNTIESTWKHMKATLSPYNNQTMFCTCLNTCSDRNVRIRKLTHLWSQRH
jgi:hypothetical protein